jgi:succinate-semialdehyde dehydrogenase/glutarate-semialdehyde dehydrogenase
MTCINPTTEEVLPSPPEHSPDQIDAALERATPAFNQWRNESFETRARLLKAAAAVLRRDHLALTRLMATEMGKPITAGEQEIEKCAWTCDYFADHAKALLAPQSVPTDAAHSYIRYDPIGPVFAIMPWNFPFWQVFRFAAPTLMAGNVAVLKHAPNVPGCAQTIERTFTEAGLPPGAFTNLFLSNEAAGKVIAHPAVRAVTLTGSPRAGRSVASQAGNALKKTVLELGGSDPFIVLPDVDVAAVAKTAAAARCLNTGQSCIAAKRFIVDESIADDFEYAMCEAMRTMKFDDPLDRKTQYGPLARLDLLEALEDQVQRSIAAGARLLCGGHRIARTGYFYEPTVLTDVRPGMPAFDEETFGPVAAIIRAANTQQAVQLANQSHYGLGASIWTQDLALADKIAAQLDHGCVFVNATVKSDARLPFGGVKDSGYGRELAEHGIREFTNIKTVWVK